MAGQLGLKRIEVSRHIVSLKGRPRTCGRLFLDSGAFGLYRRKVTPKLGRSDRFNWYVRPDKRLTRKFRKYLDAYADFILANKEGIDHYASVDVILNPELSWKSVRYLEERGL